MPRPTTLPRATPRAKDAEKNLNAASICISKLSNPLRVLVAAPPVLCVSAREAVRVRRREIEPRAFTLTEQAGLVLELYTCILEMLRSDPGRDTGDPG
jgi:hypothetical protein